jgi:CCDC81-like prokaryotic HU domain 1
MREYLFKYLVLHKNLCIPKVGVFNIENLSAQIDGTNNLLYPPSQVIRFKQEMVTPDRNFYDFLVAESGMELVDVIKHLQLFAQNILTEAQDTKGAVLEGIGTLKREHSGHLLFFADRPLEYLFPQVNIDKAISLAKTANLKQAAFKGQELEGDELREFLGQANDVEGGDNWWVYALGLLLLGIGALLFYYV